MMTFYEHHTCDNCGERPTFYDAPLAKRYLASQWRYGPAPQHPRFTSASFGYRAVSLCEECSKTHEIVVRPKATALKDVV